MTSGPNGDRRPIQFWISVAAIGGLVLITVGLVGAVFALALLGTEGRAQSDTLNNAVLLAIGGLVSLAGTVGGWLYGRGAQGEPIPPPSVRISTPPGGNGPTTTEIGGA